mgnify:CR=1 FL=1
MYSQNIHLNTQLKIWMISLLSLIVLIILVGGLTRLTDSGLSITTWELFVGLLPPLSNEKWIDYFNLYKTIPEFTEQNFNMTLKEFKIIFWWEWGHRQLGRLIGLVVLFPLIYFTIKQGIWILRKYGIIFFLVCFQGFIGWYMVSSGLVDRVDVSHFRLSIHLLIAFLILSLIFWNFLKLRNKHKKINKINSLIPLSFLVLIFIQIGIGAFVSGMDAGKIYNSWPFMGNTYFPDDNEFVNLFKISAFSDPSLVQFIHRNLAYVIGLFYLLIFYKIYRNKINDLYRSINLLGCFIILQVILGILTIIYGAQIYLASMHQISSIFLVSSSIYFFFINSKSN